MVTGPHLHVAFSIRGVHVDPLKYSVTAGEQIIFFKCCNNEYIFFIRKDVVLQYLIE